MPLKVLILLAFALELSLTSTAPAVTAATDIDITWAVIGDSYSSGEGIEDANDECARSDLAFGVRAADLLVTQRSWTIQKAPNAACTGAVSPDIYNSSDHEPPLAAQLDQISSTSDLFDVITLSVGGNDIGFATTLKNCLSIAIQVNLPNSWSELGEANLVEKGSCRETTAEMVSAAQQLLVEHSVPGSGKSSQSLPDLYRTIVEQRLTEDGYLVVAGYPRIFAPVEEWPEWRGRSCELISKTDAKKLNDAADELEKVIQQAIEQSGVSHRILYISRLELFDNYGQSHSLCGQPTTEWINGLTLTRRPEASFHPNEPGHAATAELVAQRVEPLFRNRVSPTTTSSPEPGADVDDGTVPSTTPIATGDRYELGDMIQSTCTIAWPTAPTRSTTGTTMRTTCPDVNNQFMFVDVFYPDPDLDVTPSRATFSMEGEIVDIAESEFGFKILVVVAHKVTIR